MKEITRIHLAKIPYEIENDAKKDIEKYLNALRKIADDSIFADVEIRITEILSDIGVEANGVITKEDVEKITEESEGGTISGTLGGNAWASGIEQRTLELAKRYDKLHKK